MSSKIKILFDLIKTHQYDRLIRIIKSDSEIDVNEIDDNGLYLIQYAIIFRQKDIVALLISRNCKLDILDSDGRSIFYIPIKFGYLDIVKLLINFSNVVIGVPLLEMQDNFQNIPLHYAIMFSRYDIIEDMLSVKTNINFKDNDGNTALHLIVKMIKSEHTHIISRLLTSGLGINHVNNLGQNALHISVENNNFEITKILLDNKINVNTETINDHLTPLLIATIQGNVRMCELILKYKPNINCQDVYGNTILNHSIFNKSKQLIDLYYDKVNVNLINADGNITIYLYFENKYDINKLDEYKFRDIFERSKINLQNNMGKTLWHYLADNNVWESYKEIIIDKKNKIFIQDNDGNTPYSIIETKYKNKMDDFIDLITKSFYHHYNKHKFVEFNIKLDCNDDDEKRCILIIKDMIVRQHISYPMKIKSYVVKDINLENVKFSSYTGASIDIIFGLFYIKNKYNNIQTSITENFINNVKLEEYYVMNGIQKGKCNNFLNFEIVWSYHKLFYPTILKKLITDFSRDKMKRFLVIPIGIELTNGAHANILLYDKTTNEMERFEPYGTDFPPGFNYNPNNLDNNLKNLFMNYFEDEFKYYSPSDYELKVGLQLLDTIEYAKEKNIGDPGGFCAAWSLWYVEMRLTNISVGKEYLIQKLINYIRSKRISFRSVIRSFTKNITDLRDEYLSKVKLDINHWLNNNYTEEQCNEFTKLIISNV